jgi:hypothetical protein
MDGRSSLFVVRCSLFVRRSSFVVRRSSLGDARGAKVQLFSHTGIKDQGDLTGALEYARRALRIRIMGAPSAPLRNLRIEEEIAGR